MRQSLYRKSRLPVSDRLHMVAFRYDGTAIATNTETVWRPNRIDRTNFANTIPWDNDNFSLAGGTAQIIVLKSNKSSRSDLYHSPRASKADNPAPEPNCFCKPELLRLGRFFVGAIDSPSVRHTNRMWTVPPSGRSACFTGKNFRKTKGKF